MNDKYLKGHAKIKLTDVKTGAVEVIEQDNLVTNALSDLFSDMGRIYGTNLVKYQTPIYNTALGGIILFDTALPANVNQYQMPAKETAGVVGYSGFEVSNDTDTRRGGLNASESGPVTNGYKYVYDFATNEGNGEIACVALTNRYGGLSPFSYVLPSGYHYTARHSATTEEQTMLMSLSDVERTESGFVFTGITKTTADTVTITKWLYGDFNLDLTTPANSFSKLSETTITVSDSTTSYVWYNGGDGYYYGVYGSGRSYKIAKIKIDDYTYTNPVTISLPSEYSGTYVYQTQRALSTVCDGYLYILPGGYTYGVIKISLANPEDYTQINVPEWMAEYSAMPDRVFTLNGCVYTNRGVLYPNGDAEVSVLTRNAFVYANPAYNSNSLSYIIPRILTCGNIVFAFERNDANVYESIFFATNYLATINNLDTAVTKTADKTMKITYTLTCTPPEETV